RLRRTHSDRRLRALVVRGTRPQCTTLLVFIYDATSRLMHLRFVESESTFDYFLAARSYLQRCGKPVAFYLAQACDVPGEQDGSGRRGGPARGITAPKGCGGHRWFPNFAAKFFASLNVLAAAFSASIVRRSVTLRGNCGVSCAGFSYLRRSRFSRAEHVSVSEISSLLPGGDLWRRISSPATKRNATSV